MLNNIIHGDCTEKLKEIADHTVDLVFADPPFNLGKRYLGSKDNLEEERYLQWCYLWLEEIVRVLKPDGSLFIHNIPKWLVPISSWLRQYLSFKHWISWEAPTIPMGHSLQPSHYGILFFKSDGFVELNPLRAVSLNFSK
jgi:site-specific DNA-methyltransferase (adenine-specific)